MLGTKGMPKMKILIVNPTVYSIYHLRGELLKAITNLGHTVVAVGPEPEG